MRLTARALGLWVAAAAALIAVPAAQAAGPPQLTDSWAAAVSATAVDLRATVDPGEAETRVRVEYMLASAYQANIAASREPFFGAGVSPVGGATIGAGAVAVEFARHIGGLRPATAYRYRIAADNPEGAVLGPARSFTTRSSASGPFALPDARAWEMVSPVDKNGGSIPRPGELFGGGVWQAAAAGGAVTFSSAFSFASGGQGAPGASQYLSARTAAGWSTENVTTPTLAGAFGVDPDGVPFQLFSGDLSRGLVFDPQRCEAGLCPRRYELRQGSSGALTPSAEAVDMSFAGSSPDLSRVVLSTCAALTANATEVAGTGGTCDPSQANLYAWSGSGLTLINLLPGATQGTPGATLGAQAGAVSASGARVYFRLAGDLYLRDGGQTVQVDQGVGGGGVFQSATPDGAVAFFVKAEHLYRYAVSGGALSDLTPSGGVEGMLGSSPDGSYVYLLTGAGLFLNHGGLEIGVANTADPSDYPPAVGTARVAADGTLAFLATAPLTGSDSGGFPEAYVYSPATKVLTCASCNPAGARPLGPSGFPGAVANGIVAGATQAYKPRVLSADGKRLFFDSRDALVLTDTNNENDVYEWEAQGEGSCETQGGCISLISSGRAEEGATFLDASADGADAFFVTDGSLVPADPGFGDVYDARVGGGFPPAATPIVCTADACQVLPGEPEDPGIGTSFYRAEGNPPLSYAKAKKKAHHKKRQKKKARHKRAEAKRGAGR